jgi:hypothetical protein
MGSFTIPLVRAGYESQEIPATLINERPDWSVSLTLRERTP